MGRTRALIISDDEILRAELSAFLQLDDRWSFRSFGNWSDALGELSGSDRRVLLADVRSDANWSEFHSFIDHLDSNGGRPNLLAVALVDGKYPIELLRHVYSGRTRVLHVPIDQSAVGKVLGETLTSGIEPMSRALSGESISVTTYSPDLYSMLEDLQLAASRDVPVLLTGETGTGKTHTARVIHELSPRRKDRLFPVACGALPPDLIESELFGHVRGAFTGAERDRVGKFEAAHTGTLLLDEIDVLTLAQQAKLLRIIDSGEFEAIGCNEPRRTAARLIVATNADLKKMVAESRFRADLYYRLKVVEFCIPSLRHRPRDIVPLALHFIDSCCKRYQVRLNRIERAFMRFLEGYAWPGNVRELENAMHRAVLFCRNGELSVEDLPADLQSEPCNGNTRTHASPLTAKLMITEQSIIEQALKSHGQNRKETAQALGITRVGLYKKMKKLGMINGRNGFSRRRDKAQEPPAV
jgi:DNA-binding NtrC family response regulator